MLSSISTNLESIYVGIDGGHQGAIVGLRGSEIVLAETMPLLKVGRGHEYDEAGMLAILRRLTEMGPVALVTLESAQSMGVEGRNSMFSVGLGFGLWRGMLRALGLAYITPTSAVWTKEMLVGIPKASTKGMAKGEAKKARKARSVMAAQRLYPHLDLLPGKKRVPHDGIAEAALLAGWGQRQVSSGVPDWR